MDELVLMISSGLILYIFWSVFDSVHRLLIGVPTLELFGTSVWKTQL